MKQKFSSQYATAVANKLTEALQPVCERIAIAGSLRRGNKEVGDLELVIIPKMGRRKVDMFSEEDYDLAADLLNAMVAKGDLLKRPNVAGSFTWGPKNKLALYPATLMAVLLGDPNAVSLPVDLFSTTAEKWAMTMVIRSGPVELNRHLIDEALKRGLKLHAYGDGYTDAKSGASVPCNSEEDVFKLAGVPYMQPHERTEFWKYLRRR